MNPWNVLRLTPQYREYVWGGRRLRPGKLTAEAWVVYGENRIASGPMAGSSLADIAARYPIEVLGQRTVERTGVRFPLLIKIMDCAQWMSVQVHPDDDQVAKLEGPGQSGKTEAWHIVDATPGAKLITGMRPETTAEKLEHAVRAGEILDLVQYQEVRSGDTVFMPARTIHALGPGLLIYEVQQASDFTYRVFDWNRPAIPGRVLHIEKSLEVANPSASAPVIPPPPLGDGDRQRLVACPYFTLDLIAASLQVISLDTAGKTFHALTLIEGEAEVVTEGGAIVMQRFDSAVIPAACTLYEVRPLGPYKMLKASVEAV